MLCEGAWALFRQPGGLAEEAQAELSVQGREGQGQRTGKREAALNGASCRSSGEGSSSRKGKTGQNLLGAVG